MDTAGVWNQYGTELYLFILKRTSDTEVANEVLQNTFLKVHLKLNTLKDIEKIRPWLFQIVRNEIALFFKDKAKEKRLEDWSPVEDSEADLCCFNRFIEKLPDLYRQPVELVYIKGKKQKEVAEQLGISLPNVKARLHRAKELLKQDFMACCKIELNENDKLISSTVDCAVCDTQ